MKTKKLSAAVIALILWLLTGAIGFWQIALLRELYFTLFAYFTTGNLASYDAFIQSQTAGATSNFFIIALAIIWIAVFLGSAEYHWRHIGQASSWRLFSRVFAAELAIFLLIWFV